MALIKYCNDTWFPSRRKLLRQCFNPSQQTIKYGTSNRDRRTRCRIIMALRAPLSQEHLLRRLLLLNVIGLFSCLMALSAHAIFAGALEWGAGVSLGVATVVVACDLLVGCELLLRRGDYSTRALTPLRVKGTSRPPDLTLERSKTSHAFLSHVWKSGQDQCAMIKSSLERVLPGAKIFLDVDQVDLNLGRLEEHVEASALLIAFLSQGYFLSANVLRELHAAKNKGIAIHLVWESHRNHGGVTLETLQEECPRDLADIFAGIEKEGDLQPWFREALLRQCSVVMIAEAIVRATYELRRNALVEATALRVEISKRRTSMRKSSVTAFLQRRTSIASGAPAQEARLPSEAGVAPTEDTSRLELVADNDISRQRLVFEPHPSGARIELYCSPSNPGCLEIAEVLVKGTEGLRLSKGPEWLVESGSGHSPGSLHESSLHESSLRERSGRSRGASADSADTSSEPAFRTGAVDLERGLNQRRRGLVKLDKLFHRSWGPLLSSTTRHGSLSPDKGSLTHFLLYLNEKTFEGTQGKQLVEELQKVARHPASPHPSAIVPICFCVPMQARRQRATKIFLVFERRASHGMIPFYKLRSRLPMDMEALLDPVATPLHSNARIRAMSLAALAVGLGAAARPEPEVTVAATLTSPRHSRPDRHEVSMLAAVLQEEADLSRLNASMSVGIRMPRKGVGLGQGEVGPWATSPLRIQMLRITLEPRLQGGSYAVIVGGRDDEVGESAQWVMVFSAVRIQSAERGRQVRRLEKMRMEKRRIQMGKRMSAFSAVKSLSGGRGLRASFASSAERSTAAEAPAAEASQPQGGTSSMAAPPALAPSAPLPLSPALASTPPESTAAAGYPPAEAPAGTKPAESYELVGSMSPLHPVTIPLEKREGARIPLDAKYYAYLYPLPETEQQLLKGDPDVPEEVVQLARYGGYAYLRPAEDGSEEQLCLCGANALHEAAPGEGGYFFAGPYRLGSHAHLWREHLEISGRLHELSPAHSKLKEIGARRFCWLKPNEEVA